MFRIAIVSGITLFAFAAANAGQIQIGGANGLTSAVVAGCSTGGPCTEQGYVPVMFAGAPVTGPTTATLTDANGDGAGDPVVFSLINDGAGNNFWDLPTGATTSTLTVPVGLFGVTDVWTMINDIEAVNARDISVTFNFGTSATVTSDSVTVRTSDADGASATGQVRNALVCSTGCAETAQVPLASGSNSGVAMVADNVWSQFYSVACQNALASIGGSSQCGAQGTAYLDDQGFFFNGLSVGAGLTNLNTYLVSIQVKEVTTAGGGAGLSAVTVDTAAAATPEPGTVLLFVAGLGVVGLGLLRKRAA